MFRFAAVLLLGLVGCGAPLEEQPCVENTVNCDNRCLSQCEDGQWRVVRCLACGPGLTAQGPHNTCTIRTEACVVPN